PPLATARGIPSLGTRRFRSRSVPDRQRQLGWDGQDASWSGLFSDRPPTSPPECSNVLFLAQGQDYTLATSLHLLRFMQVMCLRCAMLSAAPHDLRLFSRSKLGRRKHATPR